MLKRQMMLQRLSYQNKRWLRLLLAILLGACGTLSFSPFDFWPAALLSIMGLLWLTLSCSTRQACVTGFCWGLGLFGSGVSWIYISIAHFGGMLAAINVFLVALLTAYLSLYPMLFAGLLARFWPSPSLWRLSFAAPVLWQFTEFLRGWVLTGFPWLEFGYSQIDAPLKGLAPLLGVNGITFILFVVSGLLVFSVKTRHPKWAYIGCALLLLPWPLRYIHWFTLEPARAINVALVQGNIPQSMKWDPDLLQHTIETYWQSSVPYLGKAQLIIWPESALPTTEIQEKALLSALDQQLLKNHTALITGIVGSRIKEQQTEYLNSMIVLGEQQHPYHYPDQYRYDKYHLVPFGEYVPLANLLRPLSPLFNLPLSSFTPSSYIQPILQVNGYYLTPAICYESILGERMRANFRPQTDFLLTLSNDAWFGNSIGPWQHFQMARMRALELGRTLLRATNNGITAIVSPTGDIQASLPQFVQGTLERTVIPSTGITPYARFGSWPLWGLMCVMGSIALFRRRR